MKLDILAIGVHPDDVELSCSGTLLKHIDLGYKVGLCDLTEGELGTRGTRELRKQEAEEARRRMGAMVRENLNLGDGFFRNTQEAQQSIITVLRKYQPDIVLANALEDRHPDHGRAAQLISEACFYSGLRKIEDGFDPWRPKAVYHYIQDKNLVPDFVCDISPYIEKKMELIMAFKSQFYDPNAKEPETPISSKNFMDFIKAKNKSMGRSIQAEFAEGFNVGRIPGIENLFDLK